MAQRTTIVVPAQMRESFSGSLLAAGDAGYDAARALHNGLIDKRPGLIARCVTTADVVDAVNLGRELGVEIAVKGGGHNVAGRAVTDGGLMIDLAPMKGIHVDSQARTVRAQPGVIWAEFDRAAALHALATTGGTVSTTGIAGLTLGGGFGHLMGVHGLTADNLLSAEVVTAFGRVVTASAAENPDLFWALRGGGGNFGVVTSFEYRVHPVATVLGGLLVHSFEQAPATLEHYHEYTATAPDEVSVACGLVHAPDGSGTKIVALPTCHAGTDPQRAEADLKQLREFGPPIMDSIERISYPAVNKLLDGGFPRGALNYWKSAFLNELSADVSHVMIEAFSKTPSSMSGIIVEHVHGAAARVDPAATAYPHRGDGYSVLVLAQWTEPSETDANIDWARTTFEALRPYTTDRTYMNYLSAEDSGATHEAYGENYERLLQMKRRYDPGNLFALNQNIDPAG